MFKNRTHPFFSFFSGRSVSYAAIYAHFVVGDLKPPPHVYVPLYRGTDIRGGEEASKGGRASADMPAVPIGYLRNVNRAFRKRKWGVKEKGITSTTISKRV